jgi:hypothetical protein
LEQIDVFGGDFSLVGGVDVSGDGDAEFFGDFAQNAASRDRPRPAKGADGCAVGLVE